jgi:hypothetical protein
MQGKYGWMDFLPGTRLYHARQGQIWMKEGPYGYTYSRFGVNVQGR